MITILFDVNDEKLRKKFFDQYFADCIDHLTENTPHLWGKMTPQHMIEHIVWSFECATGIVKAPCNTPGNLLERAKRFLYSNKPTPLEFKNPMLGENPLPLRFSNLTDAKDALHKEVVRFINHFQEQPNVIHVHPVFGPLSAEEWQRSQFKHCYHHLLQFGLINQVGTVSS